MKQRIYIDTSIIGGNFDKEFEKDSEQFFYRLKRKEIIFVISDILELELLKAPLKVRDVLKHYPEECFEKVELTEEAISLADLYFSENVVEDQV